MYLEYPTDHHQSINDMQMTTTKKKEIRLLSYYSYVHIFIVIKTKERQNDNLSCFFNRIID